MLLVTFRVQPTRGVVSIDDQLPHVRNIETCDVFARPDVLHDAGVFEPASANRPKRTPLRATFYVLVI